MAASATAIATAVATTKTTTITERAVARNRCTPCACPLRAAKSRPQARQHVPPGVLLFRLFQPLLPHLERVVAEQHITTQCRAHLTPPAAPCAAADWIAKQVQLGEWPRVIELADKPPEGRQVQQAILKAQQAQLVVLRTQHPSKLTRAFA